jgi:carotenoid cleavage dioxygenase
MAAQPALRKRDSGNPFLEGAFAPVPFEVTEFDLAVTGTIPQDLTGRLLRNGPNVLGLEDPLAHHWLVGDGMVHGVQLRDGKAEWYRSRWGPREGHRRKARRAGTRSPRRNRLRLEHQRDRISR